MDNATPVEIPLRLRDGRYGIDFAALQAAVMPRTRLLVCTSPSNPLGWVATLVAQSFSKTYCMTGWRIGWLVARRDAGEKAAQLNEFIVSHAPSLVQRAAQAALAHGEEELRRMLTRLKANRDFCLAALRQMPGVTMGHSTRNRGRCCLR